MDNLCQVPAHALKVLWGIRWVGEILLMGYKTCFKVKISCVCGLSVGTKQTVYSWSVSTSVGEVFVRDKEKMTYVKERKIFKPHGNRKWGNNSLKCVANWHGEFSTVYKAWVKLGCCGGSLSQKKTFSFAAHLWRKIHWTGHDMTLRGST